MNRIIIGDDVPQCDECGIQRPEGAEDYNPLQAVLGGALGWYSGSDGELCGECLSALMRKANGR